MNDQGFFRVDIPFFAIAYVLIGIARKYFINTATIELSKKLNKCT